MNINRTLIADVLADVEVGAEVTIGGWIRTVRASKGGFSFITLNDGSCMDCIQIVADKELANYDSEITHLTAGCSLLIDGLVVESPGKGQRVEMQ
ncbi:MAG: OB-fold nucleic acid binding domain-containing protein, partial [Phycisphaerae bacterium]|nr:OB-fold nucleic acid binding domain-containing protein [Phycisphaerae bacterium]